jgi:hypothetical protein
MIIDLYQDATDLDSLPLLGFDWRDAMKHLDCTRPELFRWIEEGKLAYDGRVHTYHFSSMSRMHPTVEGGWKPPTQLKKRRRS